MNVHWLKFAMVAREEDMSKAMLLEPVEDAVQLQDVNVHSLELETFAGEKDIQNAAMS